MPLGHNGPLAGPGGPLAGPGIVAAAAAAFKAAWARLVNAVIGGGSR